MNRRHFFQTSLLAAAGTALLGSLAHTVAGKIGNLDLAEFKEINRDAVAKLAAINPTRDALSNADVELMMEVAMAVQCSWNSAG